ncbi:MAG: zinc-dependent metalloprotease [Saprospiraceae bacterium]|nr:zinc-dependent metalloprotease [Saprospiraceae bacterium]
MKHAFQNLALLLLGLFGSIHPASAQLYEVSLDEKIEKSTLIVEGKVVESQCYRADNGNIYTANKVQLLSVLKGDYRENYLTVTTWGGEIDDELQTWTHLLTLDRGDYGIFFLHPTRVPTIKTTDYPASFDVYSGVQGFIAFTRNEAKALVGYEPFHTYADISNDLFGHVARKTGEKRTLTSAESDEIRNGVRYHFTNIGFDGTSVTFDVYVNSLLGTKKLHTSGIQLGYNPAFFGSNIATNGNLLLQEVGISQSITYDLTQSNVTSSKVKIELVPVGSLTGLTEIGTTEQLLAKGKITIQNILADPGITYDIAEMQSMSKFYEGGMAQVFDTVIVEGDWRPSGSCDPIVTSVTPKSVSGGTGDVIEIRGSCFQSYVDGFSDIWFTDASKGTNPLQWMFPLKSELDNGCTTGLLVCWTDTLIKIKIPSISKFSPDSSDIGKYAGTGIIQVYNSESIIPGLSPEPITVRFSAYNRFTKSSESPSSVSLKHTLREANDNGGFTLTFGSNILADSDAKARFMDALKTWKCATKVNFDTISSFPNNNGFICSVDIGNITTEVLATTSSFVFRCKQPGSNGNYIRAVTSRFNIIFNDSISFYKGLDPSGISSMQHDFQAVALHELGHAHCLNHVNQSDDVMFFALPKGIVGTVKRNLTPDAIEGGLYIMSISKASYPGTNCTFDPMTDADISSLGCSSSTTDYSDTNDIILYPNPTSNKLNIVIAKPRPLSSKIGMVRISNILGKVLVEQKINLHSNDEMSLDLSGVPNGLLLINIETESKIIFTSKLIKL